ncbi:MAG: LysM peptidoglycan-binding domain-containing protein [Oscillospiraceae bacterium]|nr:LysM peptidoglycan-binding domain-containing protein [Oscillospiraceae bacterium]
MSNINEINYEELEAVTGGAYKPLPPKAGYVVYQIVRGDTLGRIAKAFNTTIKKIMAANPKIVDMNKIYAGDYIYIPMF